MYYLKDKEGNVWVAEADVVKDWMIDEKQMKIIPPTEVNREEVVTDLHDLMGALGITEGIKSDPIYRGNQYSEKLFIQAVHQRVIDKYGSDHADLLIKGVERYYKILHATKAEIWHMAEQALDQITTTNPDNPYIKAFLFDHIITEINKQKPA